MSTNGNLIMIYGRHAIEQMLTHAPHAIKVANIEPSMQAHDLSSALKKADIPINSVSKQQLDHQTQHAVHQGISAMISPNPYLSFEGYCSHHQGPHRLLMLDGIEDPHNFGACLRVAAAAGLSGVIIGKNKACPRTATVFRTSAGAAAWMPIIQVTNLSQCVKKLQNIGVWVYAASEHAKQTLYNCAFDTSFCLMVGNEGSGIREKRLNHADVLFSIPCDERQQSLNVSVATGITLFEINRQLSIN